jgi:hypothetical protein
MWHGSAHRHCGCCLVCSALNGFALILYGWVGVASDSELAAQTGSLERMVAEAGVGTVMRLLAIPCST